MLSLQRTMLPQIRKASEAEIEEIVTSVLPLFPGIDREEFTKRLKARINEEFDEIDKQDAQRMVSQTEVRFLYVFLVKGNSRILQCVYLLVGASSQRGSKNEKHVRRRRCRGTRKAAAA